MGREEEEDRPRQAGFGTSVTMVPSSLVVSLRTFIRGDTYLEALANIDDLARTRGWRLLPEDDLVTLGSDAAFTEVDEAARTIKMFLTADGLGP